MSCQRSTCQSNRILFVSGKTSDLCFCQIENKEHNGYVPDDLGIGSGDYLEFNLCLDCGQIQDQFPLAKSKLESKKS
jgi:hypothetical protein